MNTSAEQVGVLLQSSGGLLATAESCTGGLVADLLTSIPGASEWYIGGWVTYSNEMKITQLGVDANLIETHGAVSWQVAKAMCEGAMKQSGATASLSTTGIAGPSGGSDEKPVGTVYLGCSVERETQVRGFRFSGTRDEIRELAAITALQMMCYQLEGESVEMMCCQHGETIE